MVIAVFSDGACKLDNIEKTKILLSIRYIQEIICAEFRAYTAYICIYFSFIKRLNCDTLSLVWQWMALQHIYIYLRYFAMIFLSELGHKILSSLPSSEIMPPRADMTERWQEINF